LAILALLAFVTGEWGIIHIWLGYGVGAVIIFRLLWAFYGHKQLGLSRFYPDFAGINVSNLMTHPAISKIFLLGIALSVILTTGTGILLDNTGNHNHFLKETHEFFANLMLIFVGLHVIYLLLFKISLARFMLFMNPKE
jgi:cytochrome b